MSLCGDRTAVGYDGDDRVAASLPCKCWSCELCKPRRRKQLIALGIRGKPNKFLTLTWKVRHGFTPAEAARIMSAAWTELRKRMARVWLERKPEFLAVFEATELGWPHLHILMRCDYVGIDWIKAEWEKLTGAYQAWIEAIEPDEPVAAYVAKYVGEAPHQFGKTKRYRTSRKFDLVGYVKKTSVFPAHIKWEVQPERLDRIAAAWECAGMKVDWISIYQARATHPP